jgi:MFS family permease
MAYLSDKISRRWTMLMTAVIGLIGAIMQASANTKALFFVGRVFGGVAAAALLPVATYQAEIAPPNLRGAMIGFQFLTLTVAGSIGAWIGYGTNFSSNLSFAWYVLDTRRLQQGTLTDSVPGDSL